MTLTIIILLVLYASCPLEVSGFSSGAPLQVCSTLSPDPTLHRAGPQPPASLPYTLDISNLQSPSGILEYIPGTTYSLNLSGTSGELFRGFLVQARLMVDDTTTSGEFEITDTTNSRLGYCTPNTNAITHSNPLDKTSVSFNWIAPAAGLGSLRFGWAVVQTRQVYWANLRSDTVSERDSSTVRNDTVMGDPLAFFTVPIPLGIDRKNRNLCFMIHGQRDTIYNFVSDECVNVNALYTAAGNLNVITSIGVKAEDNSGTCRDIRVDLDRCAVSTGSDGGALISLDPSDKFSAFGISIRQYTDRVRIAVPNCNQLRLVMWIVCERSNTDMMKFIIAHGVTLRPTSHGLLGQFWNIPVTIQQSLGVDQLYNITVVPANNSPARSFPGHRFLRTWDNTPETCFYVGDAQGGHGGTVIQGRYTDYVVDSLFETDFAYEEWDSDCTA